ncbi:MAG TPA: lysine--tRNA ligase [Candidatus Nanoarchaeia archaeon]|nr:lysine--tRNA ligase [Candidatus Nanoarchaeia archaeon]
MNIKTKEKFFWADDVANKIARERTGKKFFVCASGITPSGTVHIGNFREVITTELVVRALRDMGKKVRFVYSWDDYDRLRKVPANVPKEYERYLGVPLSEIPSPFEKNKSYARHFEEIFENSLKMVGIKPEFIRQNVMNKKCKYFSLIKKALDNNDKIKKILNKYRKEPLEKNWLPIEVYCEKCKKDSTSVLEVSEYTIKYSCDCGFENKIDYRKKGIVKLKWRIDWPARWSYEQVDFEPGGNDHSVYGGSFMTAKEISKEIYGYEPPIYVMYDFVSIKGQEGKQSSSRGNILTLDEVEEIYEPEIIRYIFVGTRPNKGFEISFDNDVIKIYDEFDELERKYYRDELNPQEKRIYEMSVLNLRKNSPKKISFRHLVTLVQAGKAKSLKGSQKLRAEKVKNWLDKYADEDMKFEIQEKINEDVDLSDKQKQSLLRLMEILKNKKLSEEELFNEFYNMCSSLEIKNSEFFEGAYNVILNKNKGPRLASLILAVGKEKIIKLLEQVK